MGNWMQFEKCAGCGWDIGTGEGERSCSWGECASRAIQPVMIR
jgi:hypothetical protein